MRTANLQREFQQFIIINDTSIAPFFLYSWGNQNECLVCCCTRANDVRYVTHIDLVRQVPLLCFLHVQRHLTCFLFFFFFFLSFLFLALHLHTHTQILFLFFLSLWKAVEKGVYGLELLTRKYQIFFFSLSLINFHFESFQMLLLGFYTTLFFLLFFSVFLWRKCQPVDHRL